jgi:hypothetical protein
LVPPDPIFFASNAAIHRLCCSSNLLINKLSGAEKS